MSAEPDQAARCPHVSPAMAQRFPAAPCALCRAFVDADCTTMSGEQARQRYPQFAASIAATEWTWAEEARAAAPPTAGERVLRSVALVGVLSRSLLAAIFAAAALAVLVAIMVVLLKS